MQWAPTSICAATVLPVCRLQGGAEGFLGRSAGGTCVAFSPADPRTYLVGTEEGGVHKCSTAFTEQYTQSYSGHLAPVYQVLYCSGLYCRGLYCRGEKPMAKYSALQRQQGGSVHSGQHACQG